MMNHTYESIHSDAEPSTQFSILTHFRGKEYLVRTEEFMVRIFLRFVIRWARNEYLLLPCIRRNIGKSK